MSRVAKAPIALPKGISVELKGNHVKVKGSQGTLEWHIHDLVAVEEKDNHIHVAPKKESTEGWAMAGTTRALINNMVVGCDKGFEKKLTLIGVGYRAQAKGKVLNLNLGYSHPIDFELPEGITVETPSQTEILVKGSDKQKVGQVAAKIRSFRPPEPYKGKGVRYADENVVRKETKKK